jgi:hypothetical protein
MRRARATRTHEPFFVDKGEASVYLYARFGFFTWKEVSMNIHPKWGKKFRCFSCGCKFYDLGKSESICPKCGANQADKGLEEELLEEIEEEDDEIEIEDDDAEVADGDDELPEMEEELGYDEVDDSVDEDLTGA